MVGTKFPPTICLLFGQCWIQNESPVPECMSMTLPRKSPLSLMPEPLRDTNLALFSRIYLHDQHGFTFARSAHVEPF